MDEEFRKALTEVVEVLKNSEDSIRKKIPQEFNNFLNENMDKNYKPNIDFSKSNWEDNVKEDTKAILALIYRDYLVSKEERNNLLLEEQKEIEKMYNPNNLFKNRTKAKETPNSEEQDYNKENLELMEVKKYPWYKRIYEKILQIFGRKK